MNIRSIRNTAQNLNAAADKYGVNIPKEIRKQLEDASSLIDTAEAYKTPSLSMSDAILKAFKEGIDPLTSPDVTAAVIAQAIRNDPTAPETARHALADTIREHIEDITAAFKPVYDKAGTTLAEAHTYLTDKGIESIGEIDLNSVSIPIATQAVSAREALITLREIRQALSTARVAVGASTTPQHYIEYADSWTDIGGHRALTDPWDAIAAGHAITLALTKEASERKQELLDRDAAREQADLDAFRKSFRSVPSLALN